MMKQLKDLSLSEIWGFSSQKMEHFLSTLKMFAKRPDKREDGFFEHFSAETSIS